MLQVLKYQESYELALNCLQQSISLDPMWDIPKTKLDFLIKYLKDVQTAYGTKGKIKPKKLQNMLQVFAVAFLTEIFIYN